MIELKALTKENLSLFYDWINDKDVIRYSLSIFQKINTKYEIDNWFKDLINNSTDLQLGIYLKSSNKFIGYTGICNISKSNNSGEYFIFIGDKEQWGNGISTEVTKKILRKGFEELKLNRIMLTVSVPNIGGVKSYIRAGFKEEGILRDACLRDNKYHDKLVMSILKSEWDEIN